MGSGRVQGLGGGSKGFGSGGVGGRGTAPGTAQISQLSNTYKKKKNDVFLKDALWGGGGYPPELAWWTGAWAPRDGAISQLAVFLTFLTCRKRRKMTFFEGCPVGSGRVQGLGGGPRDSVPGG